MHMPEKPLQALCTAVVDLMVPDGQKRSAAIGVSIGSKGTDLDPMVVQLVLKIKALRNYCYKVPDALDKVNTILADYAQLYHHGIYIDDHALSIMQPAPPPTGPGGPWKHNPQAMGPIGLLLQELQYQAATLCRNDLTIRVDTHLHNAPAIPSNWPPCRTGGHQRQDCLCCQASQGITWVL